MVGRQDALLEVSRLYSLIERPMYFIEAKPVAIYVIL